MINRLVENSLIKSKEHLSAFLEELDSATKNQSIVVKSRWPSKGIVVSVYPKSLGKWLVLFFKTLRFDISQQAHSQYLEHSISLLKIFKKAVKYELIATKPKWLFQEMHQLQKLDEWLELLLNQMESQPEFSPDQREALYEWAGRLTDFPTFLTPQSLLQLKDKKGDEQKVLIIQMRKEIQERTQKLPGLIHEAIKEAEDYFNAHRPAAAEREIQEAGATIDSLFNYFINENPRPEITAVYDQLVIAASIWKKVKRSKEFQNDFQASLQEIHQFFYHTVEEHGAGRDLIAGVAYAELFVLPKQHPSR